MPDKIADNKYEGLNINSSMNVAKCIAIISVIMAHSRNTDYYFYSNVTERIGAIGVITFLIIAGYYFNVEKYGVKSFFKNKITSIVVPWVFTGTILFLIGHNFNFQDWMKWIVGHETYLYYLSMLMLCYLFLSFFNKKTYLVLFVLLNLASLLATSFGVFDYLFFKYFKVVEINNYLNVFNWIGFFSIGILLKNNLKNIMVFLKRNIIIITATYILSLIIGFYLEPAYAGYFSKLAIPLELLGVIFIFSLSTITWLNNKFVHNIAELTFEIYLTHFLTFPIRKFLIHTPIMEFINPFIFLGFNCALLLIGRSFSEKINLENWYCLLLGIRIDKVKKNIKKLNYNNSPSNG